MALLETKEKTAKSLGFWWLERIVLSLPNFKIPFKCDSDAAGATCNCILEYSGIRCLWLGEGGSGQGQILGHQAGVWPDPVIFKEVDLIPPDAAPTEVHWVPQGSPKPGQT